MINRDPGNLFASALASVDPEDLFASGVRINVESNEFTLMLETLSRALRDIGELDKLASVLKTNNQELLVAAYRLIRRCLFAQGNTHYQVLGINAKAGQDQARRRYRLLIGLFHPDKMPPFLECDGREVPRVSESYNAIKNPATRAAYNESIGLTTGRQKRRSASHAAKARPVRRTSVPLMEALHRFPLLQRYPKTTIWIVLVLMVGSVVLIIYPPFSAPVLTVARPPAPNGERVEYQNMHDKENLLLHQLSDKSGASYNAPQGQE